MGRDHEINALEDSLSEASGGDERQYRVFLFRILILICRLLNDIFMEIPSD